MRSEEQISLVESFKNIKKNCCLNNFLSKIKEEVYKSEIEQIRSFAKSGDKESANKLKRNLPAYTISGTFKDSRKAENLSKYSQYIVLDIDDLSQAELERIVKLTRLAAYTKASFISPSGNGIKIIAKVNTDCDKHNIAYNQLREYYEKALEIEIDTSGKDVSRLCFISSDKDIYINENEEIFKVNIEDDPLKRSKNNSETKSFNYKTLPSQELLDRCLKFTEKKENYIEGNRNNFIYLFSLNANRFGIKQADTEDFCITNFDLDQKEIETTIKGVYKNKFHDFAKFAKFANAKEFNQSEDKKSDINNLSILNNTPKFTDEIINNLPVIFKKGAENLNDDRERDVFITGALSIISGCLPNVSGKYGGKEVFPNLYAFVLAPAASGKGALNYAKVLADKYHDTLLQESKEALKEYENEMQAFKQKIKYVGKEGTPPPLPEEPPFKVVFIPANTSNAKIIKHLEDNEGNGIICETEADTLGQVFKNDWGSYSDLLRKAYHNERISVSRKNNNEFIEIMSPKLSVVLSGTPNQILNIISSAEDGLFSRFLFYVFASEPIWLDPSPKANPVNLTKHFESLSSYVLKMVRFFENTETVITLSDKQWEKFNPLFDEYLFRIYNLVSKDATSVVKRLGQIVFRLSMMFTALRKYEHNMTEKEIECTDQDFENALKIADIFLQHSLLVYNSLPKQDSDIVFKDNSAKSNFYKKLPNEFERKKAIKIGYALNIKQRTIDSYLAKLVSSGYLKKPKDGYYVKLK